MEDSSELLLVACFLRQALIFTIRKGGRDQLIHNHDSLTFVPLAWTCFACGLAMINLVPSLAPGLSEAHLGLVLAPQMLTWYWCLQNRGEISKSDFTAHALGLAATLVLLLTGGHFGALTAVGVSLFALVKRSSFPRSRQSFLWLMMVFISIQRAMSTPFVLNTWTLAVMEIMMMFVVKVRMPIWFTFDKRFESKVETSSQDFDTESLSELHSPSPGFISSMPRRSGPLLSFDSTASEDGGTLPSPPELTRSDSANTRSPPSELSRSDSLGTSRPHGSGHRRGISTQSSGSGWAWGLAVQDFVAKSLSPPSSSDEEEDDDELLNNLA